MPRFTRFRLMALMFLEYFVWGAWSVPISSYMNSSLGFSGTQIGWITATAALGAIAAPVFVGYVADRYFSSERILALLHMAGAVCLALAARQTSFPGLLTVMLIAAFCFMPTLPLINNLTLRNLDNPDRFPRIVVGGTVGWIVSGLLVGFLLGEMSGAFFKLAAAVQAGLALYSLTLPHTPPLGRREPGKETAGSGAAGLLKTPAMLVFTLSIPLAMTASGFYYTWTNAFLSETSMPRPTALMTLSQVSGFLVLIVLPWFIARLGMKNVLAIGMAAWGIRYLLFATANLPAAVAALLLHGFAYDFVVIGASMYAARVVPPALSARAQSFVALLVFGVGMFSGAQVAGVTGHAYSPPLPAWQAASGLAGELGASADAIPLSGLKQLPERGATVQNTGFGRKELIAVLERADRDRDGHVTRAEWERTRLHAWPQIWSWGAALALAAALLFWLGGREPASDHPGRPRGAGR